MSAEDGIKRIEQKVDRVLEHVASLDVTVARQEVHLAEHMRRTTINEHAIQKVNQNILMAAIGLVGVLLTGVLAWIIK